jgi:putative SOS response-associated peptidase YedK
MCGRYGYYPGEFRDIRIPYRDFIDPPGFRQRFNIAPTQDAPVIVPSETGNALKMFRWGLIPSWAKDAAFGAHQRARRNHRRKVHI